MDATARYDFNLVKIFMVDFQATKAQNSKNLPPNEYNEMFDMFANKSSVSNAVAKSRLGFFLDVQLGRPMDPLTRPMSTKIQT